MSETEDQYAVFRAGLDQFLSFGMDFTKTFATLYEPLRDVPDPIAAAIVKRLLDQVLPPENPLAGLLPKFPEGE